MPNKKPKIKPEIDLPAVKLPEDPMDGREIFDDLFDVVSGTECTGLIPSEPYNADEIEAYSDIYDIPLSAHQDSGQPRDREHSVIQDGTARGKVGQR